MTSSASPTGFLLLTWHFSIEKNMTRPRLLSWAWNEEGRGAGVTLGAERWASLSRRALLGSEQEDHSASGSQRGTGPLLTHVTLEFRGTSQRCPNLTAQVPQGQPSVPGDARECRDSVSQTHNRSLRKESGGHVRHPAETCRRNHVTLLSYSSQISSA